MSKGFARNGWPRGNELIIAGNLQAHATPHTKGSWVQIDASAAQDVVGMWIFTETIVGIAATDTSMLLDIGVGASSSEVVVVSNIPVGASAGNSAGGLVSPFYLPIHIPAGSRISARIQGAVTNDLYKPTVILMFGGRPGSWGGYEIAETIGVDTATSGPTTGNLTDNAWDEAIASTANSYRALTFHACLPPGNTAVNSAAIGVDVGVGAGGSEEVLGSWRVNTSSSEIIGQVIGPPFIEKAIDLGSRLAIRKNSADPLSGALIGWR